MAFWQFFDLCQWLKYKLSISVLKKTLLRMCHQLTGCNQLGCWSLTADRKLCMSNQALSQPTADYQQAIQMFCFTSGELSGSCAHPAAAACATLSWMQGGGVTWNKRADGHNKKQMSGAEGEELVPLATMAQPLHWFWFLDENVCSFSQFNMTVIEIVWGFWLSQK